MKVLFCAVGQDTYSKQHVECQVRGHYFQVCMVFDRSVGVVVDLALGLGPGSSLGCAKPKAKAKRKGKGSVLFTLLAYILCNN